MATLLYLATGEGVITFATIKVVGITTGATNKDIGSPVVAAVHSLHRNRYCHSVGRNLNPPLVVLFSQYSHQALVAWPEGNERRSLAPLNLKNSNFDGPSSV